MNSPQSDLEKALQRIIDLTAEWNANKMGGVELQRKRWLKLGEIASDALIQRERAAIKPPAEREGVA